MTGQANRREDIARAVACIERCWCSYRDRQIFKLLKSVIHSSEFSLTRDVLKLISPVEAQLLDDPCFNASIKFRFSGAEYPPFVVFKIFTNGCNSSYMSSKNAIQPSSKASSDACQMMGQRIFLDQIMTDALLDQQHEITDEFQINSFRDFMKFQSLKDNLNPMLGGRSNSWRRLDLSDVSRSSSGSSNRFCQINSRGFQAPVVSPRSYIPELKSKRLENDRYNPKVPKRRSKKTKKQIISKMRKIYGLDPTEEVENANAPGRNSYLYEPTINLSDDEINEIDDEAMELYHWSQGLTVDQKQTFSTPI